MSFQNFCNDNESRALSSPINSYGIGGWNRNLLRLELLIAKNTDRAADERAANSARPQDDARLQKHCSGDVIESREAELQKTTESISHSILDCAFVNQESVKTRLSLQIFYARLHGCAVSKFSVLVIVCSPLKPNAVETTLPRRSMNANAGTPRTLYFAMSGCVAGSSVSM